GIGLAAFTGAGLLSRVFLSGATLNLLAWSLLPPETRPGGWLWGIAAAATMLVLPVGTLGIILLTCRPANDRPIERDVIQRLRRDGGSLTPHAHAGGTRAVATVV